MLRTVRIAVTAFSLAACGLLIASWAASYAYYDRLFLPASANRAISVAATQGHLTLGYFPPSPERLNEADLWHQRLDDANRERLRTEMPRLAFRTTEGCTRETYLTIPHWCPLLVAGAIAGIPAVTWSKRFRLRALLIATTLVAAILGLITAST
jgi:hypothetical protein